MSRTVHSGLSRAADAAASDRAPCCFLRRASADLAAKPACRRSVPTAPSARAHGPPLKSDTEALPQRLDRGAGVGPAPTEPPGDLRSARRWSAKGIDPLSVDGLGAQRGQAGRGRYDHGHGRFLREAGDCSFGHPAGSASARKAAYRWAAHIHWSTQALSRLLIPLINCPRSSVGRALAL